MDKKNPAGPTTRFLPLQLEGDEWDFISKVQQKGIFPLLTTQRFNAVCKAGNQYEHMGKKNAFG